MRPTREKDLVSLEFTVTRDQFAIDLNTIHNYTVGIHTSAMDTESGTKTVPAGPEASITDVVTYTNLTVGRTYQLSGQVMVKETGEPLVINGKAVATETQFVLSKKWYGGCCVFV
ncbi:MAG: VaFE repeat-containing surface-anchored protein [Eisenbergiella sp.]